MIVLEKIEKLKGKASIIISSIAMMVFIYNTYVKDNPISIYVKNQRVQGEALNAGYDLDIPIFNEYHLRLYHSDKNSKGQYKYSYLNHNGRYYKAWLDPESQGWQYLDGKDVSFIKELSN